MEAEPPPPFPLTALDRALLNQTDEEFTLHSWEDVKKIVEAEDFDLFTRKPSQLKKYIKWSTRIKADYGSMLAYICHSRLCWAPKPNQMTSLPPLSGIPVKNLMPFADPSDYKILFNDWPYGTAPDIEHLVVWLKTPLEVHHENGSPIAASRMMIQDFVQRTFIERLQQEKQDAGSRILWFKNPRNLQSVDALEHFHVFVRGASPDLLEDWTGGDKRVQPDE